MSSRPISALLRAEEIVDEARALYTEEERLRDSEIQARRIEAELRRSNIIEEVYVSL